MDQTEKEIAKTSNPIMVRECTLALGGGLQGTGNVKMVTRGR